MEHIMKRLCVVCCYSLIACDALNEQGEKKIQTDASGKDWWYDGFVIGKCE